MPISLNEFDAADAMYNRLMEMDLNEISYEDLEEFLDLIFDIAPEDSKYFSSALKERMENFEDLAEELEQSLKKR